MSSPNFDSIRSRVRTLGYEVLQMRRRHGFQSLGRLAAQAGVSLRKLEGIERDAENPSAEEWMRLVDAIPEMNAITVCLPGHVREAVERARKSQAEAVARALSPKAAEPQKPVAVPASPPPRTSEPAQMKIPVPPPTPTPAPASVPAAEPAPRRPASLPALRPQTFGQALRACREAEGMSPADLAGLIGCSDARVKRWENDADRPIREFHDQLLELFPALATFEVTIQDRRRATAQTPPSPTPSQHVPAAPAAAPVVALPIVPANKALIRLGGAIRDVAKEVAPEHVRALCKALDMAAAAGIDAAQLAEAFRDNAQEAS